MKHATPKRQAKKTKDQEQNADALSHLMSNRLREALITLSAAAALFLFLALGSYSAEDPGWSKVAGEQQLVVNSAGRFGAWFADVAFYLFGYLAYLFPAMAAYCAYFVYTSKKEQLPFNANFLLLRMFGFLLTIAAGCGLASIHFHQFGTQLPLGSGGVLGDLVARMLVAEFNFLGTTLILLSLNLIGLTLATGISWLQVMDSCGRLLWGTAMAIQTGCAWGLRKLFNGGVYFVMGLGGITGSLRAGTSRLFQSAFAQKDKPQIVHAPTTQTVAAKAEAVAAPAEEKPRLIKRPKPAKKQLKSAKRNLAPVTGDFPSLNLLESPAEHTQPVMSASTLEDMSKLVEMRLADFGIEVKVVAVHPGPVITRFELQLAAGVKVSKITALAKDLARSLAVISVRVVEIIPGRPVIGLELPNPHRQTVYLQEVLASDEYEKINSPLALGLGKDISGLPVVVDLAKMPHLLVAGTTGSGKSVGVNGMLLSMLYKAKPEEVRLILIDPKMLELAVYDDIPHLLAPVVTDMKEAANALKWCVAEMERRYQLMAALGVRNIAGYNRKVSEAIQQNSPLTDPTFQPKDEDEVAPELDTMPFIVVVVDEFADMMMVVGKKVEELIARIAQKARAAGIHLILATQRPSVDVITGLIKANVPTRIAFQVASRIDSRTILDQMGAEQLLGRGDMLYLPIGAGLPIRVHGAFVDDHEVHSVVDDWKRRGQPDYLEEILEGAHGRVAGVDSALLMQDDGDKEAGDELYDQAVMIVTESRRASISLIQRKLKIGYNRAARLVETMEEQGVVSAMQSNGTREVLAPPPVEV